MTYQKGQSGYWLGKKKSLSQKTKDKISKTLMGHSVSPETREKIGRKSKGRIPWNKEKPWSEEMKKRISLTNKRKGIEPKEKFVGFGADHPRWKGGNSKCIDCGKLLSSREVKRCAKCYHLTHTGENAYNWKGGVRTEAQKIRGSIEFRLWREAVFARDNWTCQKTGVKGGKLHPHHILNFAQYPELRFAIDNGITLSAKSHIDFHKEYGKQDNTREQVGEFLKGD